MSTLSELLGQSAIENQILQHLHHSNRFVWVHGPSGSGKSVIAEHVNTQWKEREGDSITVLGDREQRDTPLYPLYRALKGWRLGSRLRDVVKREGAAPLRDVPFVGNTLAFLVGLLGSTATAAPRYLNDDEASLLSELQSHSIAQTPFLIIVDNVHWVDAASNRFLSRLLDDDIRENFSFAHRLRFLCVETLDQAPLVDPDGLARLRQHATLTIDIELPPREAFLPVLEAMGLAVELPKPLLEQLSDVTRGHLKLAYEIVQLANGRDSEAAMFSLTGSLPSIAMKLLATRLQSVDIAGGKLERLLRIAACIGQSFSADELRCAYSDPEAFLTALEIAMREDYLRGGDQLSFAHEIIQTALSNEGEPAEYHAKVLRCLKSLRPSDYISRFRHAILAGEPESAASLSFSIRAQHLRGDQFPAAPDFEAKIDTYLSTHREEMNAYEGAVKKMDKGDHHGAISTLTAIGTREGVIGSEISYLLALNYFKLRSPGSYAIAESLLQSACAQTDELELWYRLMSTLSIVLSNLGRVSEADRIRARIITKLRISTDPWTKKQRMILHRTASAILPPEAASAEILAAVEYFAPPNGTQIPRHAFQYVAALVNYSGVLFNLGRYSQAADVATKALELESSIRGAIRTVERYKICNNLAISALRDGRLAPNEVVTFLRATIQHETLTHDRLLILNNLAVAEALAGNLDDAFKRLNTAYQSLLEQGADRYYRFILGCNLAVVTHLRGNSKTGRTLWSSLRELIDGLPLYDHAMVIYRHAAFEAVFTNAQCASPETWNAYLQNDRPRFGESWQFYKYGFLLSDIVVWSES